MLQYDLLVEVRRAQDYFILFIFSKNSLADDDLNREALRVDRPSAVFRPIGCRVSVEGGQMWGELLTSNA